MMTDETNKQVLLKTTDDTSTQCLKHPESAICSANVARTTEPKGIGCTRGPSALRFVYRDTSDDGSFTKESQQYIDCSHESYGKRREREHQDDDYEKCEAK